MSTDKMRAEFEAKFPVPLNPTKYGAFAMQQHKDRLDGWQAASAGQAAEIARLTAKLARTRAAHVVEQELVYQIASCRDPGWGDVSKEEFDAFSESEWRKKRILYTHPQPSADDPMTWPLPCDVTVGCGTNRKGTPLSALVLRMNVLHKMAMNNAPDLSHIFDVAEPAPELAKFRNFDDLITLLQQIKPSYGDVGTQDIDVTAQRARIDSAIAELTHPQPSADDARVPDLSRLVARLMRELRKADPGHPLPVQAMIYLKRNGLTGSPLRDDSTTAPKDNRTTETGEL